MTSNVPGVDIILLFSDGQRHNISLPGLPRAGDMISLCESDGKPALTVDHTMWLEGQPYVLVSVHRAEQGS